MQASLHIVTTVAPPTVGMKKSFHETFFPCKCFSRVLNCIVFIYPNIILALVSFQVPLSLKVCEITLKSYSEA